MAWLNPKTPELITKLQGIQDHLNLNLFEREAEIEGILVAMVSKTSCFFYGDVGTAKSLLIRSAGELTNTSVFDILMSETTKADAIFGPTDIPALAQGIQRTKYKGYAPDSEILFFDEIFKANATVLNPLLWLINEKQYRNGDEGIIDCPVRCTFAASNEIPSDDTLKAIYDRLLLRYDIGYIKNQTNLIKMIRSNMFREEQPTPDLLNPEDLDTLYSEISTVEVPDEILRLLIKIRDQISDTIGNITISDRRLARTVRILQAKALISGRQKVNVEDIEIVSNIFWSEPDQAERVAGIVLGHVNASAADLIGYGYSIENIWSVALKRGDVTSAIGKLEEIRIKVAGIGGSKKQKELLGSIDDKLARAKGISEDRQTFTMTEIEIDDYIKYKVSVASAILWTPKQLRNAGFHYSRTNGVWMHDGINTKAKMANKEQEAEKIVVAIEKALGVKVKIEKI